MRGAGGGLRHSSAEQPRYQHLTGQLGSGDAPAHRLDAPLDGLGLEAIEQQLAQPIDRTDSAMATRAHADRCCLVPQRVFNARRFQVDMAPYPRYGAFAAHCDSPAFPFKRP